MSRVHSGIDLEAHELVESYRRGELVESQVRVLLGDLLCRSQVPIYAVASYKRYGGHIPAGVDYSSIANAVLLRLWNRLQRTGDGAPFDLDLFYEGNYSFLGWARVNAKHAVPSLVDTERDSMLSQRRKAAKYAAMLAAESEVDSHPSPKTELDHVIEDVADRSSRSSFAIKCLLIRSRYNFPAPPGVDSKSRDAAKDVIAKLRVNYSEVRPLLSDPLVKRAISHWAPDEYGRAVALPDRVLAAIVIESLLNKPTINRQLRYYRARTQKVQEGSR
jgi:hypothetical protein